jgi:flagellar motor switch protein FliM
MSFVRPDLLIACGDDAVERLPALKSIFEEMAADFSQRLSAMVDMPTELHLSSVSSRRIEDAHASLQAAKLSAAFYSRRLDARIMIFVDGAFICLLTEVLFGAGFAEGDSNRSRAVTQIEVKTTTLGLKLLASALQHALAEIAECDLQLESTQSSIDLSTLGRKGSVALIFRCSLRILGQSSEVLLVMPRSALDPFRNQLARNPQVEGSNLDKRWATNLHDSVVQTEIELSATIVRKGLTLEDVADFEIGQIIELPIAPTALIQFECQGRPLFRCQLGQRDGSYTVRIEEFVDDSEEFIQDLIGQ